MSSVLMLRMRYVVRHQGETLALRTSRRFLMHLTTLVRNERTGEGHVTHDGVENLSAGGAVVPDDTDAWLKSHVDKAVASGRQTPAAAAYFESILDDQPEFRQGLREARRLLGGQNPAQFTQYQQGQFADRLTHYMSGIASQKLMRAHAEEANTKRHTQDGSATGENYWFEAGNTLASPGVPGYVKDEILEDMRRGRPADSPAFDHPRASEFLASDDSAYAQHLRDKKRKMLDDVDFSGPHSSARKG